MDLDYCDVEWFALETDRDHFVISEIAQKTAFCTLLLTMRAIPFFSKRFLSTVVDKMVI